MVYVIEEMFNPILISEDDIHINVDKFESGESNILQITGLSGSGKSTLSKELAKKYNAYLIETDIICFAISRPDRANWEYIKEHDKYLYKYMKEKNISPEFMMKYHYTTITRATADERDIEGLKYLRWLYFEADVKEHVIVEGGCVAFAIMKDDKFLKIPTIFKGTSIAHSMLRRLHRSAVDDKKGYVKALQIAAEYFYKQYSKMVPEVNSARSKFFDRDKELPIFISDDKDIYINFNKFTSGEKNKILILGLSGSGKSTLADKLARKYNIEHVNLDRIRGNKYYTDEVMQKENPSIYYWLTHEFKQPRRSFNDLPKDIRKKEWERCFYWLLKNKTPMIIEGHFSDILKADEDIQKNYPIIFKRTSMSKSIYRMLDREVHRWYNGEYDDRSGLVVPWLLKHASKYFDYKDEIDSAAHSVMKHYPSDYQELDEASNPIVISEDDIYINFNKFKSGESKIVQITGLSGSGKSTLAKEIANKYNAYLIQTDTICFAIAKKDENATWDYIKNKDKYLYQYMKEKNLPVDFMRKYGFVNLTLKEANKRDYEGVKFLKWLCFEADIKEPVVVEGGYVAVALSVDDSFLQIPTIFKGTSLVTSLFRRFNRHSGKKGVLSATKHAAMFYVNQYSKMIPEVNAAREKFYNKKDEMVFTHEATYPDKEEYDLNNVKFTHIDNPHYKGDEPYIYIEGKKLRVRGELIVFDKQGRIFVAKRIHPRQDITYAFPGGGIEPNESVVDAAIRETEEEALIVPKNVKYSGYHYRILFDTPKGHDMKYEGVLAYVCVGEYDKKYSKYVKKQDRDDIAERGKWIYPEEIDLAPVHKMAIESYKKSSIQESCEGIYDEDETRYLIENKTKTIEEFYKCLCDNFQYGIVYDKDTACPKPSSDRINFDKYRTLSVDEMLKYRIGVCWDYVELESYYFKKKFGYDNTVGKLQNKKFSVYYIQFEDKDGDNPTHTWLAYMNNGKVYSFEVSWYTERGIKKFDTETDMIEHYWKIHKEHCSKQCKVYRGLVLKYKPFCLDYNNGFNLDCEQFMDAVLKKGKIIKSEFKEYPVSLIVNESILPALTFYHGSPEKLDKIEPVSFSAGNKFRKPEWAVFMFKQKEMAEDFAFSRAVHMYLKKNMIDKFEGSIFGYMEKVGFATYKYHHYIRAKYYDELKNLVKGLKYYVYTLEVPIDSGLNVIGTTWTLPEYTYTGKPKVVKREEFVIDDKSFDSRYEPLSDKIFDRYNKNKIYKENVIGPWMYLLIDMEDRSKKRKIALKKMKSGELKPGDDLSFLDNIEEATDILAEMDTTFLDTEYE